MKSQETKIFDLKVVEKKLKEEIPQHDEENDLWFASYYLGSILNILPSGKYYVPFACSNVEVCETCAAAGHVPCTKENPCKHQDTSEDTEEYHCEACRDARWYEDAEKELDSIGASLFPGEGDPTDLHIWKEVEAPENEE